MTPNNSTSISTLIPPNDYLTIGGWALFGISEILPFLKKKETSNGLIHTIICLLKGSKCFIDKALKVAESNMAEGEEEKDKV